MNPMNIMDPQNPRTKLIKYTLIYMQSPNYEQILTTVTTKSVFEVTKQQIV